MITAVIRNAYASSEVMGDKINKVALSMELSVVTENHTIHDDCHVIS